MRPGPIKGLHKVAKRLANGETKIYLYAWKGGPRLSGEPGSPAFRAAYAAAVQARRAAPTEGSLAELASEFRTSPEFADMSESTRAEWSRMLDLVQDVTSALAIGSLPIEALADFRVKRHLFAWRDQWRATPRKADYAMQVLSSVLSWAVERGRIPANVVLGRRALYKSNRADKIWTPDEVDRFVAAAPSPEVGHIVRLACLTGLRRDDLLRLEWGHVGKAAIVLLPNKSRRRSRPKKVIVPLLDETLALLVEIGEQQAKRLHALTEAAERKGRQAPRPSETVLSNTRACRWSKNGAEHQIVDTKKKAGIDKHLHDCRGTFATRLRHDGASISEIADILGWEEKRVERLLALYVDTEAVVTAFAERIRAKSATRRESPS